MSTFKDIEQLTNSDIESFFETDSPIATDFVEAASRSKLPKAMVSRHTYVASISPTQLVMWAKRRTIAKTLADLSCCIGLEELSIEDTWNKKSRKGCELLFPDGQRVLIESKDPTNIFIDVLIEQITKIHSNSSQFEQEVLPQSNEEVFSQPGVARHDTHNMESQTLPRNEEQPTKSEAKTPVVTRDVVIESLKRAKDGAISEAAIKQWAMRVRDCTIIDADEAMVSYILFSLSRLDLEDKEQTQAQITEFYERLTITLV